MYGMTAAHKTLPIPCYARITNLSNGRSVVVRINDRGPFVGNRIVDLSYSAATRLDIVRTGTAFVELRTVGPEAPGAALTTPIVAAAAPSPPSAPAILPTASVVAAPAAPGPPMRRPPCPPRRSLRPRSARSGSPALPQPSDSEDSEPVAAPVALYIQVGAFADEGNAQRLVATTAELPDSRRCFRLASADSAGRCGGCASARSRALRNSIAWRRSWRR